MGKSISLTIRIDEELKRNAEIACSSLEHTLSSFIRSSLKDVVRSYHRTKVIDGGYQKAFMETEEARQAYEFLKQEVAKSPDGLQIPKPAYQRANATWPIKEVAMSTGSPILNKPDIKINNDGKLDPKTMPRKLRRKYARDSAKGKL